MRAADLIGQQPVCLPERGGPRSLSCAVTAESNVGITLETTDAGEQRRALRRHRAFATALLVAMAVVYVAITWSGETGFWIGLLRAGAEAAMVGGLADWFAVTALFRRPLGLPIPHTAVIPASKDRIGTGLGNFIERHFLEPELVAARLRAAASAGGSVSGWRTTATPTWRATGCC